MGATRVLAALLLGDCVSALRDEANAPLLGHAAALLLEVANREAAAGDRGSRLLRTEAFQTLDCLLRQARGRTRCRQLGAGVTQAVRRTVLCAGGRPGRAGFLSARHLQRALLGHPEVDSRRARGALCSGVLSASLPQSAGWLTPTLPRDLPVTRHRREQAPPGEHAARVLYTRCARLVAANKRLTRALSSAASSADATTAALGALTAALRVTLSDRACAVALVQEPVAATLDEASRLLSELCQPRADVAEPHFAEPQPQPPASPLERMRVCRSSGWVKAVDTKLGLLLPPLFAVLCRHVRGSVRAAAAAAAAELMSQCCRTLLTCTSAFLECLLCLAHDPWPQVSAAALHGLGRLRLASAAGIPQGSVGAASVVPRAQLREVLLRQLDGLDAACSRGERDATAAARLLTGAISLAGPCEFVDTVLLSPALRRRMCERLALAFTLSGTGSRQAAPLISAEPLQVMSTHDAASAGASLSLPRRHRRIALLSSDEVRPASRFHVRQSGGVLTRLAVAAPHARWLKSYESIAGVARLVGRAARVSSPVALMAVTGV